MVKKMAIAAACLAAASGLSAQTGEAGIAVRQMPGGDVFYQAGPAPAGMHAGTFEVVTAEVFPAKTVKGVPFSAQAVTETTQVLSDGNRIHRQTTASIYRDGEGRMRREQAIGAMLPFGPAGDSEIRVFISDPVSGTNFVQNPRTNSCEQTNPLQMEKIRHEAEIASSKVRERLPADKPAMIIRQRTAMLDTGDTMFRNEPLGTQVIEGVQAEGTRTVLTIPAGQIGNERPIETVSERWYSPDLQMVVLSKHSDPRMGETVYKLTSINRVEPPATLFQVPETCQARK